jgi:hypothetical protein
VIIQPGGAGGDDCPGRNRPRVIGEERRSRSGQPRCVEKSPAAGRSSGRSRSAPWQRADAIADFRQRHKNIFRHRVCRAAIGVKWRSSKRENAMVLCPVALAVGCKGCPIFNVCPVKGIIGDYRPEETGKDKPADGGKKKK